MAERTGLSPHVLRVWERRYSAVEPGRAEGGQRFYADADVKRLRLIRTAIAAGRSIGQVARLSTDELTRLVGEDETARQEVVRRQGGRQRVQGAPAPAEDEIERAFALVRAMSAAELELLLRRTAASLGVPTFLDAVAVPLLGRMHDAARGGELSPAQEHLATAAIQRVVDGIVHFLAVPPGAPNLLLATPVGVRDRIGAGLAAAAAAVEGWRVIPIAAELPAAEIAGAADGADVVGVSVVQLADHDRLLGEIRTLRTLLPQSVPLLVGGAAAGALAPALERTAVRVVEDLSALRAALRHGGSVGG